VKSPVMCSWLGKLLFLLGVYPANFT